MPKAAKLKGTSRRQQKPAARVSVSWDARFKELIQFNEEHGHCNVPQHYKTNPKLGAWVSNQRRVYNKMKRGKLSSEQIKLLEEIGFIWNPPRGKQAGVWDERFSQLKEYKDQNGHCRVYEPNPQLGLWVDRQRQLFKNGKLSKERIESLNRRWDERFEELQKYKEVNGHCRVPDKYTANLQLATWVQTQRQLYKKNKLSPDRFELLHNIGFEWQLSRGSKPSVEGWNERFKELIQFNEEHGHCNVPQKYKANPELGLWVTTQRTAKKNQNGKKITEEQINRLEGIGFKWVLGRGRRPTRGGLDAVEAENLSLGGEEGVEGETSSTGDTICIPLHRLPPIVWPATKSSNP